VPNCKSFLVTEAERKHVRRRALFQQHRDASCHQDCPFLQGKASKEINAILTETLGEHATSYFFDLTKEQNDKLHEDCGC